MIELGRICLKIAGRDANKKCVVLEVIDDKTVLIDGETRRKKCNIKHLEPTRQKIAIKKGASHAEVVKEFAKLNIKIVDRKPKKTLPRPKKARKQKKKEEKPEEKKPKRTKQDMKENKREEKHKEEKKK